MQTFLPYPDFKKSAQCLDNKRLGKQRVEAWQIYQTLQKGEFTICPECKEKRTVEAPYDVFLNCKTCKGKGKVKTSWYHHPCVSMWKGYEDALLMYGMEICEEWTLRGFKDTMLNRFWNELLNRSRIINYPIWLGNENFHRAMQSNLLRKDPKWYGKFGWKVPNNLPYIWGDKQ